MTDAPTAAPTTKPREDKRGIFAKNKIIPFGSCENEIEEKLGAPSDKFSEPLKLGGTIKNLIYAENYAELAVFQLLNDSFVGFYSCSVLYSVVEGENFVSPILMEKRNFDKVKVERYYDSQRNDAAYAFWVGYGGFSYTLSALADLSGQEKLIFHATNGVRAINGAAPLEYSKKASDCARAHSADMAENNYFSHDSRDGRSAADRMKAAGIDYYGCGENIAKNYDDAFDFTNGWYNSPGHRKNMLARDYKYLGVGVAPGNENVKSSAFATQNYYSPRMF